MPDGDEETPASDKPKPCDSLVCRKQRFKAVIFDLDGTLVDTELATCEYIASLLRPHGLSWTIDLHQQIAGTMHFFPERCLELLDVPAVRREELLAILPPRLTSPEYTSFLAERMRLKPGAAAVIRRLQSCRFRLALCTSRRPDGLDALLVARPDLAELLSPLNVRVVGSIDPRTQEKLQGKPHPEVYVVCAEILGVSPEQCLVFEDAPAGILSAKAAGAFTVAVPEAWMVGDSKAAEAFALADRQLESLGDLKQQSIWDEFFWTPAPLLIGCGNANVDVTCAVTHAELSHFGLALGTEAPSLDDATKAAIVNFAVSRSDAVSSPGGAALNAIRVASWSAGAALRTAFVGAVGTDAQSDVLRKAMADVGVVPLLKVAADLKTGVCAALIERESKDRTLSMVRGAAAALDAGFLDEPGVYDLVADASWCYLTSFLLTSQPRIGAAQELVSRVRRHGGHAAINLSSAGLMAKVRDPLMGLLPKSTYVFGNLGELRALRQLLDWPQHEGSEGDHDAALRLAAMLAPGGTAVITAGSGPTIVATSGLLVKTFPVPPVPQQEIEDTTGAGDAFVGGFLAKAIVDGPDLEVCIQNGHTCAAAVLRKRGCDLSAYV